MIELHQRRLRQIADHLDALSSEFERPESRRVAEWLRRDASALRAHAGHLDLAHSTIRLARSYVALVETGNATEAQWREVANALDVFAALDANPGDADADKKATGR